MILTFIAFAAHGQTRPAIVQIAGQRFGYTPLCFAAFLAGMSLWFVWSGLTFVARSRLRHK